MPKTLSFDAHNCPCCVKPTIPWSIAWMLLVRGRPLPVIAWTPGRFPFSP